MHYFLDLQKLYVIAIAPPASYGVGIHGRKSCRIKFRQNFLQAFFRKRKYSEKLSYKNYLTKIILQKLSYKNYLTKIILQKLSYKNYLTKIILQKLSYKNYLTKIILQKLSYKNYLTKIILQKLSYKNYLTKIFLQKFSYKNSYKNVLTQIFLQNFPTNKNVTISVLFFLQIMKITFTANLRLNAFSSQIVSIPCFQGLDFMMMKFHAFACFSKPYSV